MLLSSYKYKTALQLAGTLMGSDIYLIIRPDDGQSRRVQKVKEGMNSLASLLQKL